MATLAAGDQITPIEVAKRFGGSDQVTIIEALSETNELLLDAAMFEATDGTINKTTQRTSQPAGQRRLYNEGIIASASKTKQIEDGIVMLEDYSDVDADLADHSPNKKQLLESEDRAFLNGMGITMAEAIVYDNEALDANQINGIIPRLHTIDTINVFNASGAANFCSCLVVAWGKTLAHLFYPRGHTGLGIKREFQGKVHVLKGGTTTAPKKMPAYETFFSVHFGFALRNPKAVKRVCNINPAATTGETVLTNIIKARNKLPPEAGAANVVIYANSDVKSLLDIYAMTKSNACYYADDPWGRKVTMFQNMRVRQLDALTTESVVS